MIDCSVGLILVSTKEAWYYISSKLKRTCKYTWTIADYMRALCTGSSGDKERSIIRHLALHLAFAHIWRGGLDAFTVSMSAQSDRTCAPNYAPFTSITMCVQFSFGYCVKWRFNYILIQHSTFINSLLEESLLMTRPIFLKYIHSVCQCQLEMASCCSGFHFRKQQIASY
jgi:hypothetical protein